MCFIGTDIHKNNILANLPDTPPPDRILLLMSENAAEFCRFRNNQLAYAAGTYIKINICHNTKALAVTHVNYFFLSQLTYSQNSTPRISFILSYAAQIHFIHLHYAFPAMAPLLRRSRTSVTYMYFCNLYEPLYMSVFYFLLYFRLPQRYNHFNFYVR